MPTAVNLRVARRPLDTLGVVFSMLRAGIRPLLVAVFKYAGLPALIGGAGVGAFYGGFFAATAQVESGDFSSLGWGEGVGAVVGFLGLYAAYTVSMLLAAAWTRCLADGESSDPDALWDEARPHLGPMLRLWLLLFALGLGAMTIFLAILGLFASASSAGIALFFFVLALPVMLVLAFLISPVVMMTAQVMLAENLNAHDTLRRAWDLLAGARGGAGVLVFVVSLIVSMVGYALMIPLYGLFIVAMVWGGADDLFVSMEKMGYALGFVISAVALIPRLLYFLAAGALYYARIEATEHVGFTREVGSLMAAFPDAPASSPPPLPGSAYAESPPFPNDAPSAPTVAPTLTDEAFFAWTEPEPSPEPPSDESPFAPPPAEPPAPPVHPSPDTFDRWRGPRPESPPADAS